MASELEPPISGKQQPLYPTVLWFICSECLQIEKGSPARCNCGAKRLGVEPAKVIELERAARNAEALVRIADALEALAGDSSRARNEDLGFKEHG